jgi:hypothetical protein
LAPKSAKIYSKPAWDKCNSDEYKKIIQTEIRKQKNTIKLSVSDRIATLENTLRKAGRKSIPKYFSSRLGEASFSKCILQASIILFWLYSTLSMTSVSVFIERKKGYDKEKTNIASSTATSIRLKEG